MLVLLFNSYKPYSCRRFGLQEPIILFPSKMLTLWEKSILSWLFLLNLRAKIWFLALIDGILLTPSFLSAKRLSLQAQLTQVNEITSTTTTFWIKILTQDIIIFKMSTINSWKETIGYPTFLPSLYPFLVSQKMGRSRCWKTHDSKLPPCSLQQWTWWSTRGTSLLFPPWSTACYP